MSWENLSLPRNTFNLLLDGREYPTAQNPKMRITTGILIVLIGKNFFPIFPSSTSKFRTWKFPIFANTRNITLYALIGAKVGKINTKSDIHGTSPCFGRWSVVIGWYGWGNDYGARKWRYWLDIWQFIAPSILTQLTYFLVKDKIISTITTFYLIAAKYF